MLKTQCKLPICPAQQPAQHNSVWAPLWMPRKLPYCPAQQPAPMEERQVSAQHAVQAAHLPCSAACTTQERLGSTLDARKLPTCRAQQSAPIEVRLVSAQDTVQAAHLPCSAPCTDTRAFGSTLAAAQADLPWPSAQALHVSALLHAPTEQRLSSAQDEHQVLTPVAHVRPHCKLPCCSLHTHAADVQGDLVDEVKHACAALLMQ